MAGKRILSICQRGRFMRIGYNTNGFAHHHLEDALAILAELGYQSVAITLDNYALNPFDVDLRGQIAALRSLLEKLELRSTVETGARFLLDPWQKHQPTLVSEKPEERETRLAFLRDAVWIARELGSDAVSLWSGTPLDNAPPDVYMNRLVDGCRALCDYAGDREVRLAFEQEPGMFIDTMARFADLQQRVAHPSFGLTIDIGHLHCQGEIPISDHLRRWRDLLWNVHIEDMREGIHDHLMFGDGEIDFKPVMETLKEIGYAGGVHVELSRHSHDAVNTARRAIAFLRGRT
jgi:sugar phosphate isomerase/epimerase